jgi:predicted nucleic acid-binding protein
MLELAFFDTNIFLYAYSRAPEDLPKRDRARELLLRFAPVVSTQVLQEFIAAALRKPALAIGEPQLDEFLALTAHYLVLPVDRPLILHATTLRRRFSISHWDSTLLAAAHASGCSTLYSEDLQHGFALDQLTIVNPFQ